MALYWPQGGKKDNANFGKPICNPWGQCYSIYSYHNLNVLAFINNLGLNNKPNVLKVGPQFFWL
jgi:hypothetical protein